MHLYHRVGNFLMLHSSSLFCGNECGYYAKVTKYGMECKERDVIEMELDLNNLTFEYIINGKNYGIAFDNTENCNYRAAVTIFSDSSSTSLLY